MFYRYYPGRRNPACSRWRFWIRTSESRRGIVQGYSALSGYSRIPGISSKSCRSRGTYPRRTVYWIYSRR